ncbi:MAG: RNA methyltransferase [Lachnospiraceae bacterium]|nr:RNA methyltransferase [Lachnospiraceae bacterium]
MEHIQIDSLDIKELEVYSSLNEPQIRHYYEPEPGLFIAESVLVIERALDAGYEPVSVLVEHSQAEGNARECIERIKRCGDVPVYEGSIELLSTITGFKITRGILCAMRRRMLPAAAEVCDGLRRIVVLDEVVNPTNVGAIFRSAAALGMEAVLLTPSCADPLYRRALRVSMGTVMQIPWTYLPERDWIGVLKAMGYSSAAMALRDNSLRLGDERLKSIEKLAVVMGTEGSGLSDEVINACDHVVMIPMQHGVDSLNVAAASAVAFWELGKQAQLTS